MTQKKNKSKSPLEAKKTDHNIPTFSIKSAFLILLSAIVGVYVIPSILSLIGVPFKLGVVISGSLITPLGIAYSRCFVESKDGYGKKFYLTYIGFAIAFMLITSYWMYKGIFI